MMQVLSGMCIFLTLYLFWRINLYDRRVYTLEKRNKELIKFFLSTIPEDERAALIETHKLKEKWGEL